MQIERNMLSRLPIAFVVLWTLTDPNGTAALRHYSKERKLELREQVRGMFQHAYEGYLRYAADYDELRPLTCDGVDTWGSYSLTLIDALDTLATMGNYSEFRRVAKLLEQKMDFDKDINVSVFETNIRIVGGLLSAHLLSKRAGVPLEEGWPCQGPLLRLAEDVAKRLLPAFETATGMPYGTVNLRYGVPKGETPVTCTAGVGTLLVEFGTLSRLTGNPIYEDVALNSLYALWKRRSPIGLFGNHIDVQSGRWTALDSGIGAGVDSLFEYLAKGAVLLQRPELLAMFHEARSAIDKYLRHDDWYVWAGMNKGQVTLPVFQSLESFWPGVLSLIGDIEPAMRTIAKYSSVWRKYGFLPEFYNIPAGEASPNRESYPLRPELVESAMYLYRATNNEYLLELGEKMLQTIEHSAKTRCGYATIRNVVTHEKENRMESFFLAETTKYLYLLFDEDNFLHNEAVSGELVQTAHGECVVDAGAYVFNTEAHPIDMSALYCCHSLAEDIFDGLDMQLFNENALLREEREERERAEANVRAQYECPERAGDSANKRVESESKEQSRPPSGPTLAVDIEVYDEDNNPAADILIENFERVKGELAPDGLTASSQRHRNQLTVSDLKQFFGVRRDHFESAQQAHDYVVEFMRNYTLDSGFISGLHLFDASIGRVLGVSAQREFEGRMRTLWELYVLQQEYVVNVALVTQLGLDKYEEENRELLQRVSAALGGAKEAFNDDLSTKVHALCLQYVRALVNTTAMEEFLFKILVNGTNEKQRLHKSLLSAEEVRALPVISISYPAQLKLFIHVRRLVDFKKHMIETFEKLQALVQEAAPSTEKAESSTVAPSTTTTDGSGGTSAGPVANGNDTLAHGTKTGNNESHTAADSVEEQGGKTNSVWSQLVQTILRKATSQANKFDISLLEQKTRKALQQYANQPARYELLTCSRPKFIERFAYRHFHP